MVFHTAIQSGSATRDAIGASDSGNLHHFIVTPRILGLPRRDYPEPAGGMLRDMAMDMAPSIFAGLNALNIPLAIVGVPDVSAYGSKKRNLATF